MSADTDLARLGYNISTPLDKLMTTHALLADVAQACPAPVVAFEVRTIVLRLRGLIAAMQRGEHAHAHAGMKG